ncbi:MAG: DedA family protein [Candidatus Nanohalobium sp.]
MVLDIPIQPIIELIRQYEVLAVVVGMVIEEVAVPIPSPIIPMAAGAILVQTDALLPALIKILFVIVLPASIASVLSSYFVYGIAYFGGKPVLGRWGKYLDISWEEAEKLEEKFAGGNEKYYVALFRALPIVPLSLISGSAGLFRMDWKQYGVWSFIGMVPRNFVLAFIGWYVRDDFIALAKQIDTLSTAVLVIAAALAGGFIAYRKAKDLYRWILFEVL